MSANTSETTTASANLQQKRIFVGNLSFKINSVALKEGFSGVGTVTKASVVSRNGKRLGFGFVQFENEKDAAKAVDTLNGSTLEGREIKVAFVTPNTQKKTNNSNRKKNNKSEKTEEAPSEGKKSTTPKKSNKNQRKPRRPRIPLEEREESDDVVYVRDLPESTTREQVKELFKDYGCVSVITKRAVKYSKKERTVSRFAFVTVDSAENQRKAVDELNEKEVDGSKISVRKAFKMVPVESEPEPTTNNKSAEPAKKKRVQRKKAPAKQQPKENSETKQEDSPKAVTPKKKRPNQQRKPNNNTKKEASSPAAPKKAE